VTEANLESNYGGALHARICVAVAPPPFLSRTHVHRESGATRAGPRERARMEGPLASPLGSSLYRVGNRIIEASVSPPCALCLRWW
jgi:hypothetical protein